MKDYRRIPLEHLKNCRDLGGYSCGGGKMIRYHQLYRSEALEHLTRFRNGSHWRRDGSKNDY